MTSPKRISQKVMTSLRCKICTSNKRGGTRYPPFAFTQAGVAMLSGLLHSKIAVDANILLGASVKDMGVGVCAITKMEASPEAILQLLK